MASEQHDKKTATMAATLEQKTGRSVDGWIALLRAEGPEAEHEWQAWLKEQGLGHFQARLVVSAARERRGV